MLHIIDAGLSALLRPALPTEAGVSFAVPDSNLARRAAECPTVNLFLHFVSEDARARAADWTEVRDERGRVVARKPPPKRYRVSYALTAWAADADDEHRLLGAALAALAPHETVPSPDGGSLTADGPASLEVAVVDNATQWPQVWTALGVAPRARIDLAVTVPVAATPITDLAAAPSAVELGVDSAMSDRAAPTPPERPPGPRKRVREDAGQGA